MRTRAKQTYRYAVRLSSYDRRQEVVVFVHAANSADAKALAEYQVVVNSDSLDGWRARRAWRA